MDKINCKGSNALIVCLQLWPCHSDVENTLSPKRSKRTHPHTHVSTDDRLTARQYGWAERGGCVGSSYWRRAHYRHDASTRQHVACVETLPHRLHAPKRLRFTAMLIVGIMCIGQPRSATGHSANMTPGSLTPAKDCMQ